MIAVLQRVNSATVYADGELSGKIGFGLYILLGVENDDTEKDAELLCEKILKLRIFSDENDKMNLSVSDLSGDIMVVSNFTLNADYSHGNRPSYFGGASPEMAERLYTYFLELVSKKVSHVASGVFGASMRTELSTNGPVTIIMNSAVLNKDKRSLQS